MKQRLNRWIVIPSLVVGILVGWLGWIVTDVSCRADRAPGSSGCTGWSSTVAILGFVGTSVGMAIVLALTTRSIAEYRQARDEE
jgi:hypothetical protein